MNSKRSSLRRKRIPLNNGAGITMPMDGMSVWLYVPAIKKRQYQLAFFYCSFFYWMKNIEKIEKGDIQR